MDAAGWLFTMTIGCQWWSIPIFSNDRHENDTNVFM